MQKLPRIAACLALLVLLAGPSTTGGEPTRKREPWTQSRLKGSPEPPLPYLLEQAFSIEFSGPVSLNRIPDTNHFLVCEQDGAIYFFDGALQAPAKILCADFNQTPPPQVKRKAQQRLQLFSLTFHPEFQSNRFVYICYVTNGPDRSETHISRFELPTEVPSQLQIESEVDVLTCEGGGHNGCTLAFGNDGYLYISIGDLASPNPPDPRNTGQDISDLYSSILRIDVDRTSENGNYSIPEDNPFVDFPSARPEVYAYGFRNPFRMSFDPPSGDLWVGDVGWEAWEMVYRVRSGGNYGWAVKEGPGDVKPQEVGPTPIIPADIALNHSEAASVTGGMVYRGNRYPDLSGTYIFGDWITRKFWSARFDTERLLDFREIAVGTVKPICFEADADGELLILDYSEANQAAGIFRLVPNPTVPSDPNDFPHRLSETGLFASTALHKPARGVTPYRINAPMWMDGAEAEYLLAIPGHEAARFYETPKKMFNWFKTQVELPIGSVLAKTYSCIDGESRNRIETQISLKDEQGDWQYYSYRWNDAGTDATLVSSEGDLALIDLSSAGSHGRDSAALQQIEWQFGSRTSCRICHTPWTGETVGFIEPQLRATASAADDTWHRLIDGGYIRTENPAERSADAHYSAMVDPADAGMPLDRRVRSYLHSNCAHCHLNGGNASTALDVSFQKSLAETRLVDETPMRGDLGLQQAKIIVPGNPSRSVLLFRIAKTGAGRMPHIGSQKMDPLGVGLLKQWISQLPRDPQLRQWLDELCAPVTRRVNDEKRLAAATGLLGSIEGAIELSGALAEDRVPQQLVRQIVDEALTKADSVRDLIEPYAASDQRITRLGVGFQPEQILSLSGDAEQGRQLFNRGLGTCSGCHQIGLVGKEIGPDLSQIATKLKTPEAILNSIMHPSLEIEDKYRATSILTDDGQVIVGRVIDRRDGRIMLQDAAGNSVSVAADGVEVEKMSTVSLMPEQLLAPLTPQQAADLIAYLHSLH